MTGILIESVLDIDNQSIEHRRLLKKFLFFNLLDILLQVSFPSLDRLITRYFAFVFNLI